MLSIRALLFGIIWHYLALFGISESFDDRGDDFSGGVSDRYIDRYFAGFYPPLFFPRLELDNRN